MKYKSPISIANQSYIKGPNKSKEKLRDQSEKNSSNEKKKNSVPPRKSSCLSGLL